VAKRRVGVDQFSIIKGRERYRQGQALHQRLPIRVENGEIPFEAFRIPFDPYQTGCLF
jgi:hypothetical protein